MTATANQNKISTKTQWVSTSGWRGYSEPIHGLVGANDTGSWSDSPCPTETCKKELRGVTGILRANGIRYKSIVSQTSNVFCISRWVLVAPADFERAKALVADYVQNECTLAYIK